MIRTLPDEIAELLAEASPGADAATDKQVAAFFTEHQAASRPDVLNGLRSALVNNIEAGKSRHDSAVSAMAGAMKEARAGYYSLVAQQMNLPARLRPSLRWRAGSGPGAVVV